jgi:hypothetical protein
MHYSAPHLLRFRQPATQVGETLSSRDVIHKERARCISVVRSRNGAERLLACCVPDLQLHLLSPDLHDTSAKVHPDREVVHGAEPLVHELQEQTRLAHSRVP